MKKVTLKSLTLTNFRGEQNRTTMFNPIATTIAGDNGLGKSRHFDAFIWLLFGKDKEGRDNFEIKTRIDGEELHNVECSVVGVLDVDGEEITLKRELSEKWVKPRGQVESVLKGNETLCWVNDVPMKVGEYQQRVKSIIDETVFKLITNPAFFFSLKWQDQRDILFQLAGTVDDKEIASTNSAFAELLDRLTGKSLSDFKKELSARKKRLKEDLEEIQPRIDQTHRLMPESADFDAIGAEIANTDKEIADIERAISDVVERTKQQYEAVQKRQLEINSLKSRQQKVLFDAQSAAKEKAHKANSERNDLIARIRILTAETEGGEVRALYLKKSNLNAEVEKLTAEVDALRAKWHEVNATEYTGETTCAHCGQELPDSMKSEALNMFKSHKQGELDVINEKGKGIKEQIDLAISRIQKLEVDIVRESDILNNKKAELEILNSKLEAIAEVKEEDVKPENIKEYTDLAQQIADLEAELKSYEGQVHTDSTEAYKSQKKELSVKRDELKAKLSDRGRIEQFTQQIAGLEARGKELARQIADAEREEYTIAQFNKAKINECEKRINSMFSLVTFKLFDYNIEDAKKENPIECCIPLVRGRYYASTNTADQVNAGIDVINTLSQFHGVSAPIFIDGRESVNEILATESQIINLVVTTDKELIIITNY